MNQICLSSFLKISQKALQAPNLNQDVVNLLIGALIDRENIIDRNGSPVDITPAKVSGWFNKTKDVEQSIRDAVSFDDSVVERCKNWFGEIFIPTLNINLTEDFYSEMKSLVEQDEQISEQKRDQLLEKLNSEHYSSFLAELFLYCLSRSNTENRETVPTSDYYLLSECDSSCPTCGKRLTENIRNNSIKKYDVIQFDFLDPQNDKLCLCRDCADIYVGELSEEEQQEIIDIKEELIKNKQIKEVSNSVKLEKDILEVINNLSSIDLSSIHTDLTLNAVELKKKIHPENYMLIFDINTKVTSYYNTVRNIFSNLEGEGIIVFEKIASQVKLYYLNLEEENIDQSQIYEEVTDWIHNSSGGNSNRLACQIIAAFFVQNCEVFNEISE
ncbi:ABC-three component system protein [Falseniella ignava]|uniref:ABC-three component systems C-terminal domain-containing protein n=1 Tax=Falseniella ignava CCUG 37419 TaxID=883112 RepID=K1LUB0_9LACT|nr:ABC-three component system protein [Falseniella ignava]EKB53608.1 hypothetical protein HMPREF9707_01633 [Falseniella ignava CCUG 37419]